MRRSPYTDAPRFVRVIWLAVRLFWGDWVEEADYRYRFGPSMHRFRQEVKAARGASRLFDWYFAFLCGMLFVAWITGQR
jgi:cytochrome b